MAPLAPNIAVGHLLGESDSVTTFNTQSTSKPPKPKSAIEALPHDRATTSSLSTADTMPASSAASPSTLTTSSAPSTLDADMNELKKQMASLATTVATFVSQHNNNYASSVPTLSPPDPSSASAGPASRPAGSVS